MARLKSSDDLERRTAFIGCNVTPSERAEIVRRAKNADRRLSDYVRQVALSDRSAAGLPPKLPAEVGRKLAYELARIGGNLNQLSFHANASQSMPEKAALEETLNEIVKATEALTRL